LNALDLVRGCDLGLQLLHTSRHGFRMRIRRTT
jgi:hypothetical protein